MSINFNPLQNTIINIMNWFKAGLNKHNNQITSLSNRITALENRPPPTNTNTNTNSYDFNGTELKVIIPMSNAEESEQQFADSNALWLSISLGAYLIKENRHVFPNNAFGTSESYPNSTILLANYYWDFRHILPHKRPPVPGLNSEGIAEGFLGAYFRTPDGLVLKLSDTEF